MDPAAAVVLQTPTPGLGPAELEEFVPELVRAGWFLAGAVVVVVVGWALVEPAMRRVVERRNRKNPTIQEAITRYVRLTFVLLGVLVGAALAGYGQLLSDSALVVAAATLALGVAARTVIGSLVSGLVLVNDPEFNIGDCIEWDDGAGVVESITLRVTRVLTPAGELVTIPNTVLTGHHPAVRPRPVSPRGPDRDRVRGRRRRGHPGPGGGRGRGRGRPRRAAPQRLPRRVRRRRRRPPGAVLGRTAPRARPPGGPLGVRPRGQDPPGRGRRRAGPAVTAGAPRPAPGRRAGGRSLRLAGLAAAGLRTTRTRRRSRRRT